MLSILNEEPENEGPEGETDASIPVELAYLKYQSDVSFPGAAGHKNEPDLVDLSEKLERLCAFIDNYKGKGGRPRSEAWNVLMMELGVLYEDVTGKKPTVTENDHRAEAGERYSGAFVRLATLVDGAIAELCGVKPRPNSALGPALRRLLRAQQNVPSSLHRFLLVIAFSAFRPICRNGRARPRGLLL